MSLKTDALTIKNETVAGSNTATRIGGLFENIAEVTETVDTIADLRAFDTSNLTEGESVYVKAHNTNGLKEGYGGGTFVWIPSAVFQTVSSSIGYLGSITTTALKVALSGDGEASHTNEYYGDELVLSNGAVITITSAQQSQEDNTIRSYGVGETSIRVALDSGTFTSGLDAYFKDDDGVYIRPTFATFDGAGQWIRKLPEDNSITVDMYGAIGHGTKRTPTPFDSTSAIQKAFDSLFYTKVPARYYYVSSTIFVRRPKFYEHIGFDYITQGGRFSKFIEGDKSGVIYTDQDIDVLDIRAKLIYHGEIDCTQIPTHTKRAFRINANDRVSGEIKTIVTGNVDSLGPDLSTGTQAIVIDQSDPELSRDMFSSNGAVSGLEIYCKVSDCYIGVGLTAKDPDVDTFTNGIDVYWGMDNVKRPIDFRWANDLGRYDGVYQSRSGLLSVAEQSAIPIMRLGSTNGGYIDCFGWDMVGSGRHNRLIEITGGTDSYIQGGPRIVQENMWNQYIPSATKQKFDLSTRLRAEKPFKVDDSRHYYKHVERVITSSEILASNTSPITVLAMADVVDNSNVIPMPVNVYIKPYGAGTVNYGTNTNMKLLAGDNFATYTVSTIDLSSLLGSYPQNLQVAQRYGAMFMSKSTPEAFKLQTETGDPTGGDKEFTIVIDYKLIYKS